MTHTHYSLKLLVAIFLTFCATMAVAQKAEGPLINIQLDQDFNIQLTDRENRKPERCFNPKSENKPLEERYKVSSTDKELPGKKDTICRIYLKPTVKLEEKKFSITLHKGSYILTLTDDNGSLFQLCYNDDWVEVDCSELT